MAKKRRRKKTKSNKNSILMVIILFAAVVFFFRFGSYLVTVRTSQLEQATHSIEQKEDFVYNYLIEHGYSVAGACGILGNISVECPKYDPTETGANGSYGLFQWTDTGDRKNNLKEWCKENKYDAESMEGQLEFALYELNGGDSIAVRVNEYLQQTDDAYTAAVEFCAGFERCVCTGNQVGTAYTGSLYPEYNKEKFQALDKRINAAVDYYERYHKEEKE